jgi:phosphoribosylaminoimidazole carboxylase PurE protein
MGSDSDLVTMAEACKQLDNFGIPYEIHVSSAHRTPDKTVNLVHNAQEKGVKVFIAGAGGAAHLAGVVAGHATVPVIGVPMPTVHLGAADSLYSTVQMPPGIPVATVSIGKWGATNAGILAAQILAVADDALAQKVREHKESMAAGVEKKDAKLQAKGYQQYLDQM